MVTTSIAKNKLPENHFFVEVSSDIHDICQPLFECFDVSYFGFSRTYDDGATAFMGSDTACALNLHNLQMPATDDTGHYVSQGCYIQKHIEGSLYPAMNAQIMREAAGTDHAALLFKSGKGYVDLFFFSTGLQNDRIYSFYVNNIDLLERFAFYFEDKAEGLIEEAKNHRIIMPKGKRVVTSSIYDEEMRKKFLSKITPSRYRFKYHDQTAFLSKQEAFVLFFLSRGKSLKETACLMSLSPRTVESYLQNLKSKLNCFSKSQAIDLFLRSGLAKQIDMEVMK